MNIRSLAPTLGLLLLAAPSALDAQVPQFLNYQGRVAVGTPPVNFDGSGLFKFALVDTAGTTVYWSSSPDLAPADGEPDTAVSLTVTKGLYSVLLGDTTIPNMAAIPPSVFNNPDVHLRVWFDDGGMSGSLLLSPDQRLASVGYAIVAGGLAPGGTIPASAVTGTPPPGMVLIPGGEFTMGNSVAADTDLPDAVPTIATTVSSFYMDVNTVSLSQWARVYQWATLVGGYTFTHPGTGKGADHPVHTVDWYDCVKWCNARSEREGKTPVYYTDDGQTTVYRSGNVNVTNAQVKWGANGYRLPTEAEWEKAARGGLSGKRFPWGDTISQKLANYIARTLLAYDDGPDGVNAIGAVGGSPETSPVGSFGANGYGLNDMAGNVFGWCWDWHGTPYAGGRDPHGPDTGVHRVPRGGFFRGGAESLRCAYRSLVLPTGAGSYLGFRAVLSAGQP